MEPRISLDHTKGEATFAFDEAERKGTVTCKPGGYGLDIEVTDGETKWLFLVDLFYLAAGKTGSGLNDGKGCVQIVAYHPQDHDGDPVQHLRVWPDGRTEIFKS